MVVVLLGRSAPDREQTRGTRLPADTARTIYSHLTLYLYQELYCTTGTTHMKESLAAGRQNKLPLTDKPLAKSRSASISP